MTTRSIPTAQEQKYPAAFSYARVSWLRAPKKEHKLLKLTPKRTMNIQDVLENPLAAKTLRKENPYFEHENKAHDLSIHAQTKIQTTIVNQHKGAIQLQLRSSSPVGHMLTQSAAGTFRHVLRFQCASPLRTEDWI